MTVRTRFAPSPTGFLHVGGIRTALFAYLVAKQAGGEFTLRIEDTDRKRLEPGSMQHIQDSLNWLGISWDKGPYQQSDRLELYKEWAQKLVEQGRAYADPYTAEEVQEFREQASQEKKPFLYRNHRPDNPPEWDGSRPLRFKSDPKSYQWHDEVMGDLHSGPEVIDDFILMKSDGYPTYNFAHIVDDADMNISHVIRGQEFLSSMPNYLNLYDALGLNQPTFATMPHVMNETGNKKLSKRDGAKDVLDYGSDGYLPETLLSFIATLGWNDGTEQEVFTKDELVEKFSLTRVQKSGARFDEKRLLWMNGQFIRDLTLDELHKRVSTGTSFSEASAARVSAGAYPTETRSEAAEEKYGSSTDNGFWPESAKNADEAYKKQVLALAQDRLKTLVDLPTLTSYFFEEPSPDMSLITENKQLKKLSTEEITGFLQQARDVLSTSEWNAEAIQDSLNQLLEMTGQKPGTLFSLIRIATTWAPFSPQLNDTLALLGKEQSLSRLDKATTALGEV